MASALKVRIERPPPPHAVGDDHQHVDRAIDVGVFGNVASLGGGLEHADKPFPDVGVERRRYARDLRVAPGLRHDLGAELHLLDRANGEVVMRHAFEHGEKTLRQIGAREILRDLGAVALGDAGDDRLLGGEIAIQVAGAHAGLGADLLHRGLMEAGAHKAALGGAEDLVPAVRLPLNIRPNSCIYRAANEMRMNVHSHELS